MITLLKFDRFYSEKRNHINPAMENLILLSRLEKENSFILYKTPLKTVLTKSLANKFGVRGLSQLDFSKINSGKVFILNPSLLNKDTSGMNRLFQHCQDHDIDVFTYVFGEEFKQLENVLRTSKGYNHQIFDVSYKPGTSNWPLAAQNVKRDMILKDLVS